MRNIILVLAFLAGFLVVIQLTNHDTTTVAAKSSFIDACEAEASKSMTQPAIYCNCAQHQYESYYGDKAYKTTEVDDWLKQHISAVCSQ